MLNGARRDGSVQHWDFLDDARGRLRGDVLLRLPLDRNIAVWNLTSGDAHEFFITNVKEGLNPYVQGNPYRRYRDIEVLFYKRSSDGWQLRASYVYSKTTGTVDNGWGDDIGWNTRDNLIMGDPNYWINADGNATFDPTHMIKVQGTYVLPFGINFNAYFRAVTGNAWNQRFRSPSSLHLNAFWPQNYVTAGTDGSVQFDDMVVERRVGFRRAGARSFNAFSQPARPHPGGGRCAPYRHSRQPLRVTLCRRAPGDFPQASPAQSGCAR